MTCPLVLAPDGDYAKTNSVFYLYRTNQRQVKGNLPFIDAKDPFNDVESYSGRSPNKQDFNVNTEQFTLI